MGLVFLLVLVLRQYALVIFGEIIPKNLARGQGRTENIFHLNALVIAIVYNILVSHCCLLIGFLIVLCTD